MCVRECVYLSLLRAATIITSVTHRLAIQIYRLSTSKAVHLHTTCARARVCKRRYIQFSESIKSRCDVYTSCSAVAVVPVTVVRDSDFGNQYENPNALNTDQSSA